MDVTFDTHCCSVFCTPAVPSAGCQSSQATDMQEFRKPSHFMPECYLIGKSSKPTSRALGKVLLRKEEASGT